MPFDPAEHPDEYEEVRVTELKIGDVVCYVQTMFGLVANDEVRFATVEDIASFPTDYGEEWKVYFDEHDVPPAECDEDDRVWRRKRGR